MLWSQLKNLCYHITYKDVSILIDPAESDKAFKYLNGRPVSHILCTHHHYDHCDANPDLKKAMPHLTIVGGTDDDCAMKNMSVKHNDVIVVGPQDQPDKCLKITCLHTPCHTRGSMCYLIETIGNEE